MRTLLIPLLALGACAEPDVDYIASIYGEEYIEDSIPASVFVDGWSVTFDRFLVSVGEVAVEGAPLSADATRFQVFDLSQSSGGAGFPVGSGSHPAGGFGYVVAPAPDAVAGNASADDVALMKQGGHSVYIEGTAKRDADTLTFAFGFATRTNYHECDLAGAAEAQITIHGDHLFYDDLFSSEPNVSFDLVASADDGDGNITADELRAVDITTLERYQVGDLTNIKDLWSFIEQQTTTVGHINGEGHCHNERLD